MIGPLEALLELHFASDQLNLASGKLIFPQTRMHIDLSLSELCLFELISFPPLFPFFSDIIHIPQKALVVQVHVNFDILDE